MTADKSKAPKLLLDEQIWVYLATLLREQGFDVIHAYESDLEHKPDAEVLRSAVENHRAVVTFNTRHFIPLAREYFMERKQHYGIVVSDEIPQGELQRRVTKLLESVTAEDLKNMVRYLQEFKQE
jgi:predicted nuclease of predicted toxin-antitoxin system